MLLIQINDKKGMSFTKKPKDVDCCKGDGLGWIQVGGKLDSGESF